VADRQALEEERDFCLRSLKDLDAEFAAGDIDEGDYQALRDSYTVRAAAALRRLSGVPPTTAATLSAAPAVNGSAHRDGAHRDGAHRDGAHRDASEQDASRRDTPPQPGGRPRRPAGPLWRRRAAVAVGAVLITAGACWAVVASSATRLPGEEITGKALGSEQVAAQLLAAQKALSKGDDVSALKAYQKILASQPDQPEALTGEGWLLAQTQQPALLNQGLGMLARAERAAPQYAPAHLYRGIALLSEDDYADAVPELQWYLDHSPDPQLAPKVRQALQQAEAKASQG
jgi:hypothetical protein